MKPALRVLLLEDNNRDAQLIQATLEAGGLKCAIQRARNRAEFEESLAGEYEIGLYDYSLPDYDGYSALLHSLEVHPSLPVILVSGVLGEEEAIKCLKAGASDYLFKHSLKRLPSAVEQAITKAEERKARRAVEQRLYETEQLFSTVFEHVPSPLVLSELDTSKVLETNKSFEKLFGYARNEVAGKTFLELGIMDQASSAEVSRALKKSKDMQVLDLIMRRKSGHPIHCVLIMSRLHVKGKECVVTHVIDASAEDKLREAEHFYRTVFQTGPAGMIITDFQTSHIREINDVGLQLLGYNRADVIGRTIAELKIWDDVIQEEVITQICETGSYKKMEVPLQRKAGTVFPALLSLSVLDTGGERRIIGHFTDLSAEIHLREMEKLYGSVFTLGPGAISITSTKDGRILDANEAALKLFGFERSEILGVTSVDAGIWTKETRDAIIRAINDEGAHHSTETVMRRKSGEVFPAHLSLARISFGGADCIVTHIKDLTSDVKLRETEKLYSTTFLQSAEAIFITEQSTGRIVDVNKAGEHLYGVSKEEMVGKTAIDLGFIDANIQDELSRLLIEKGAYQGAELVVTAKNGKTIPVLVSQALISKGDIPCVLTQLTDVSSKNAVEEILRFTSMRSWEGSKEGFFSALAKFVYELAGMDCCLIAEQTPDAEHVKTLGMFADGNNLESREFSLRGTPCAKVIGNQAKTLLCGAQDAYPQAACLKEIASESYFGMPLFDSSGASFGVIALLSRKPAQNPEVVETILKIAAVRAEYEYERWRYEEGMERHHAELETAVAERTEALKLNVSLLSTTLESTTDGILVTDLERQTVVFNKNYQKMWSVPDDLMKSKLIHGVAKHNATFTADPDGFLKRIIEIYADPNTQSEDEIYLKDGRVFERYSAPQRLGERVIGRVWSVRDITERKKAEAALTTRTNELDAVISNAPFLMVLVGEDCRVVQANQDGLRPVRRKKTRNLKGLMLGDVVGCVNAPEGAEAACSGSSNACGGCAVYTAFFDTLNSKKGISKSERSMLVRGETGVESVTVLISTAHITSEYGNQVLLYPG